MPIFKLQYCFQSKLINFHMPLIRRADPSGSWSCWEKGGGAKLRFRCSGRLPEAGSFAWNKASSYYSGISFSSRLLRPVAVRPIFCSLTFFENAISIFESVFSELFCICFWTKRKKIRARYCDWLRVSFLNAKKYTFSCHSVFAPNWDFREKN